MKFINSFKSIRKQKDKIEIIVRLATLTIFELSIDFSSKSFRLIILNLGIQS